MPNIPASIRFNNPGAMWGGNKISKKWGATATITLNDGLGQGNTIAFFPSKVAGAAAQFDLWRSSYCNLSLDAATRKWSGGNSSPPYIKFLNQHTGLTNESIISPLLLASDTGWRLMKAQAQWEAGQPYPMTDEEWKEAQQMCFAIKAPVVESVVKKGPMPIVKATVITSVAIASGAAAAQQASVSPKPILLGVLAAITTAFGYIVWKSRS